jgi:hypothetical protein
LSSAETTASTSTEQVLNALGIVAERDDLRDTTAGELDDAGLVVKIRIGAGENLDAAVGAAVIPAHPVAAGLPIVALVELGDDLLGTDLVAHGDHPRGGENHGGGLKGTLPQLAIDQAGIADVVKRERD